MRAEIKQLHESLNSTTVYVTHDQEEAMTLGDRVVVMKDGVVQQCASALDIYHRPANRFVAGFLGSPPMNFFEGRARRRRATACTSTRAPASYPVPERSGAQLSSQVGKPGRARRAARAARATEQAPSSRPTGTA